MGTLNGVKGGIFKGKRDACKCLLWENATEEEKLSAVVGNRTITEEKNSFIMFLNHFELCSMYVLANRAVRRKGGRTKEMNDTLISPLVQAIIHSSCQHARPSL